MLQKWIIERKVTRADRISRHGQPWARLGTLEDLAPFFDVVDEADRARAAVGRGPAAGAGADAGHARAGGSPLGLGFGALQTPASGPGQGRAPASSSFQGLGTAPRSTPESQRAVNRSLELLAVEAPVPTDEPDTSIVMRPSGRAWWKLLVTFSVAGGVFYFGIRAVPSLMVKGKPGAAQVSAPGTMPTRVGSGTPAHDESGTPAAGTPSGTEAVAPGAIEPGAVSPGAVPGSTPAGESPIAVAPGNPPGPGTADPTAAAGVQGASPAAGGTAAVAPAVVPAAPVVEARPAPEPAPARSPAKEKADKAHGRARGALAAQGQGQGEDLPYDRLVAQADRLLENGSNERALRLYERALSVRPDAPEALTGIGYVHLDRNRTGAAIEFFTKASAASPFAPALFGLGQAYRAAGDPGRARQTYQRYLALYPTGSDASAAERNLQALQPGNAAEAPGTILHEGGSGTPAGDPAK
jgi:hypothetical protein